MKQPGITGSTQASSRLGRLDAYWCAVVAICLGSFILRLWFGQFFTWFADDWTYFVRANTLPMPRFLFESYNGHVGPGQFLLVWLLNALAPLSFQTANAVAALIAVAGVGVWAAAFRRIFGARPGLLVPIALLAFSPTLIWSNLWWASAVQVGPLQLCLGAAVYCAASWAVEPSRRRLWALLIAFAVGLFFWEKAIFCLLPIVTVIWMMLPGGTRQRLRTARPAYVAAGGLAVGYLLLYAGALQMYPGTWYAVQDAEPDLSPAGLLSILRGVLEATRDALAPALIGGPWGSVTYNLNNILSGRTTITSLCGVLVLALLLAGAGLRRHGLVPVLMCVTYVGVLSALTVGSTMGAVLGVAAMKNPRLFADSLSVMWLAVLLLLMPTVTERREGIRPWRHLTLPRPLASGAVFAFALVAMLGTVSGCRALLGPLQAHHAPREWVANLRHDVEAKTPVLIVDGRPPADVYGFGFWPDEAWLSKMLAASSSARFAGSSESLFAVQRDGSLQESAVKEMTTVEPGPVEDCGYALGAGEHTDLPLTDTLYAWNWAMEAAFFAGQPGELVLTVDGVDVPLSVQKGVSTLYAPINSTVSDVSVAATKSSGTVCLVGMKFGSPTAKAATP